MLLLILLAFSLFSTANLHYEKFSDGTVECIREEIPFAIPKNWNWVRLENICYNIYAGGDKPSDFVKEKDAEHSIPVVANGTTNEGIMGFTKTSTAKANTITIAGRGTIGFPVYRNYEYCPVVRLIVINQCDLINPHFLYYYLYARRLDSVGSSIPQLTVPMVKPKLIPLPPLEEQERISLKLDLLFNIINNVNTTKDQIKTDIEKIKSKILDLAIRGKLVEQDLNEEPASVLLERIRKEKEELIKSGKLKRDKRESVIFRGDDNSYYETIGNKRACIDSEIHYDIPEGWTVERLKNLYSVNPKNDIANDETIVSFVPMNLINDQFLYNCTYELKQWKDCKKGFTHFADGDLGFAKISPCFENRKSVVFSNLKNGYGAGTTELYILRNFCEGLNPEYAILFLKSESFIERGVDTYSGTVGQQRIDKNIMMDTIIPIPPQNEQQRIADRVKQLFSILDSIQATLV